METRVIGFIPPLLGVDAALFNTFRLGGFYAKHLKVGELVYLMDEKAKLVFGSAEVTQIDVGRLADMCVAFGAKNHTQLELPAEGAHTRVLAVVQKIYGPHIAVLNKKTVVIHLKRLT